MSTDANASAMRLSLDGDFDCSARPTNESDWATVMFDVRENADEFGAIKLNSPFAGKKIIAANYYMSSGYHGDIDWLMEMKGEIDITSSFIRAIIRGRGFSDSWNRYILVFDPSKGMESAEVFHIGKNEKPEIKKPAALRKT
ncbi:MAG TPA: hypothetical protein VMV71_02230 [Candidatus Paceibacterota bacterium]|nr:hypothetical protein [Candidatus Paceibacterota bacterium]